MKLSNNIFFKIVFLRGKQTSPGYQHMDLNRAN